VKLTEKERHREEDTSRRNGQEGLPICCTGSQKKPKKKFREKGRYKSKKKKGGSEGYLSSLFLEGETGGRVGGGRTTIFPEGVKGKGGTYGGGRERPEMR